MADKTVDVQSAKRVPTTVRDFFFEDPHFQVSFQVMQNLKVLFMLLYCLFSVLRFVSNYLK